MFLPMVLSSLFLAVVSVSSKHDFQLDIQSPGVLLQPSNGGPAYYILPQDLRAVEIRKNGALSTVIYFVELYNKLQHFATAFIQPYTLVSKPKPALAPAAAAVIVGAVPVAQGSVQTPPSAPGRNLSPEEIPAGYIPPRFYTSPSDVYLV